MTTPLVFKYSPDNEDGSPQRIGWVPGFVNAYGMVVVPARITPADWKMPDDPDQRPGIDNTPKYTFVAGKPFQVVEGSELHQFVRSSQLFRKVLSNEYTIAGDGSVLLADNVEAAKIPFHPHPTASR
jgi:hypothetical protein